MKLQDMPLLHGGDYNPDQWLDRPDILERDIEMMREAHVNVVSLGIFSWAHLEPTEGQFELSWLREIIDNLYRNGVYTILATPTGARPNWLSHKYEETRRVNREGRRDLPGGRHNHCYTSPIYREKTARINRVLAEAFADHPAVICWHISNEYSGECFCPLCADAFRDWLKRKYGTLEKLNFAWWAHFWSHTYTEWDQILPPFSHGEAGTHGLNVDWKRFCTDQTVDFCRAEIAAIRAIDKITPTTTNLMGFFAGVNYFKFAPALDIVSWDSYPRWHGEEDVDGFMAVRTAMTHDLMRSIKREPFLLMESTPSTTNWMSVSRLKRPGMHMLSSMQAIAHGADSVQYFQWRKGRGSMEKFHGAVVDHSGRSDDRVFRDVSELGERLASLPGLRGTAVKPEAAIIYDWENRWAIEDSKGPRNIGMQYLETLDDHYRCFWEAGVSVDVIDMECDVSGYKIVVAPMLYMLRAGIGERLREFVRRGGVLVATYMTGLVDENDLCHLGDTPGDGLAEVFGIRREEIDSLADSQENLLRLCKAPGETYKATHLCEIIHAEGAEILAEYATDFYAGTPALTRHTFGEGQALYLTAKAERTLLECVIYGPLLTELGLRPPFTALPKGVTVGHRAGNGCEYYIVQNYSEIEAAVETQISMRDAETGGTAQIVKLRPYEVKILIPKRG